MGKITHSHRNPAYLDLGVPGGGVGEPRTWNVTKGPVPRVGTPHAPPRPPPPGMVSFPRGIHPKSA